MNDNPRNAVFERIRLLHRHSAIGKKLGISELGHLEEWRNLPPTVYSDYEPIFEEIASTGPKAFHLLGPSPVIAWAQTSGTTGNPKKIPINKDFVRSYQRTTLRFQRRVLTRLRAGCPLQPETRAMGFENFFGPLQKLSWALRSLGSKTLCLTAPSYTGSIRWNHYTSSSAPKKQSTLPIGFMSGWMAEWAPWWAKPFRLPSLNTLRLPTWDEKIPKILEESQYELVRIIAGIPAVMLHFCEAAKTKFQIPHLQKIWPHLGGVITSGTALTLSQKEKLQALFGPRPLVVTELYAATEGQFGYSSLLDSSTLELNESEVLFTFRKILSNGQIENKLCYSNELQEGCQYSVFASTPGGLLQYSIGDRIEVIENPQYQNTNLKLDHKPVRVHICGRDQEEISLATEKISRAQTHKIFSETLGGEPEFILLPVSSAQNGKSKLLFLIAQEEDQLLPKHLAKQLDYHLKIFNPSYSEMRKDNWIYEEPEVIIVPHKIFDSIQKNNQDKGQFKLRRLYSGPQEIPDEFKGYLNLNF